MAAPFFSWNILCVYLFAWVCVYVLFCARCVGRANCIVLCITNGREDKKCNNYGLACCNGLITSSSANLCIILIICIFLETNLYQHHPYDWNRCIIIISMSLLSTMDFWCYQFWRVNNNERPEFRRSNPPKIIPYPFAPLKIDFKPSSFSTDSTVCDYQQRPCREFTEYVDQ